MSGGDGLQFGDDLGVFHRDVKTLARVPAKVKQDRGSWVTRGGPPYPACIW